MSTSKRLRLRLEPQYCRVISAQCCDPNRFVQADPVWICCIR